MDEHRVMTDRKLRDEIIARHGLYVFDEAFHDDDVADEPDAWPHGWWIIPAVIFGLLFWAGIIIAMVFWIASLL